MMSESKYRRMNVKTANSKVIQSLKEGPKFASELPCDLSIEQRKHVSRLRVPRSGHNVKNGAKSKDQTVYYLWGDDRRAVRRMIHEHRQFFEQAIESGSVNVISSSWGKQHVELALEEWEMGEQ